MFYGISEYEEHYRTGCWILTNGSVAFLPPTFQYNVKSEYCKHVISKFLNDVCSVLSVERFCMYH